MTEQTKGYNRDEQRSRPFNPNEHVIEIKTKNGLADYLPVQWRLVWFRSECPDGSIETEPIQIDLDRETEEEGFAWNEEKRRSEKVIKRANGFAMFHAVVKNGKGGIGTGTKSEKAASFPDYIEKAETGAIGRALAALGFGTQFAPELDEEHRIVDSPVKRSVAERSSSTYNAGTGARQSFPARPNTAGTGNKASGNGQQTSTAENATGASVTEKQLISIRKLCEYLGKPEPENQSAMSYVKAKELIDQLTLEYRQRRSGS